MRISAKKFLFIHLPVLAAIVIYFLLPIKCPIKYFFDIPCPTCGMTRAMIALLKGDVGAYLGYNPLALPFLLLLLFAMHGRLFGINRKIKDEIIIIGSLCVAFLYIFRVFFI